MNRILQMGLLAALVGGGVFYYEEHYRVHLPPVDTLSAFPLYQELGSLVINLVDDEEPHYAQLDVSLVTHSKKCAKNLPAYVPIFRSRLLDLLSRQSYESMLVPEKRESFRVRARDMVKHLAMENMKYPRIDDLLFTGFVVQ
ncbi:MAG: flagellar basal body-associated FliL family protein [Kistimonas sp.]|nr:flagellar basal body-associated FliL family protein [Kistimonas sp.]